MSTAFDANPQDADSTPHPTGPEGAAPDTPTSRAAFGALAEQYRPQLLQLLARRPVRGVEADDIVQETFARAYASLDTFDPRRPIGPWLVTIALNVAATHSRRRRECAAEEIEPMDRQPLPDELVQTRQQHADLWVQAEQALSARQFDALRLRYKSELPVSEIARAMGLTQVHVKVLLFRARQKLLKTPRFVASFSERETAAEHGGQP